MNKYSMRVSPISSSLLISQIKFYLKFSSSYVGTVSNNARVTVIINSSEYLFQSRDIAHKEHLQTDSFSAHKALNEYYDGILPLVDGLVESYQGKYAKIEIADWNTDSKQPIIPYFESLLSYIDKNKDKAFTDSSLLNQVDEIKAMVQGTLYKLKELN